MELTTTAFEIKLDENYTTCLERHGLWVEDTTGTVARYTDEDAYNDAVAMTVDHFVNLGHTAEAIAKVS